jgi:SAM-dependent methyltransferase
MATIVSAPKSALLSPEGRELLERLAGEAVTPDRALELARALRGQYPTALIAAALTQQSLRTRGLAKFSRAGAMLFTRTGLEQASSEAAARHSADRFRPFTAVADLCCGIGGNLAALAATSASAAGRHVLAVDADLTSLEFARHNAAVYGPEPVTAVCADVRELRLSPAHRRSRPGAGGAALAGAGGAALAGAGGAALAGVDAVFIDPARRSGGRRLPAGSCEPPLCWCLSLAEQVPAVGIKTAPGLKHELVPAAWEMEFVAVGRDLKEAMLWSPALATTRRRATVLPDGVGLVAEPGAAVPVAAPGAYLFDPSPAVTRAGLVEELARQLGVWKIDPMIAFLSGDRDLRTPLARTLRIIESAPWNERAFARRLNALDVGAADIRRRGLAGDVAQIHRRLNLRGQGRATVVITRMNGRPWGIICADADAAATTTAQADTSIES